MKKYIFVIFLVLFGIASLGGYFVFSRENLGSQDGKGDSVDLVIQEGVVHVSADENGSDYRELEVGTHDIYNGEFVETMDGTSAYVTFFNGSVASIDESSRLQIDFNENKVNINQTLGNTWHRVQKLSKNEEYNVTTDSVIAGVRGTIFAVGVSGDESSVWVEEGLVVVEGDNSTHTQYLDPGESVVDIGREDVVFYKEEIPQKIKKTQWYKKNKKEDEPFLKSRGVLQETEGKNMKSEDKGKKDLGQSDKEGDRGGVLGIQKSKKEKEDKEEVVVTKLPTKPGKRKGNEKKEDESRKDKEDGLSVNLGPSTIEEYSEDKSGKVKRYKKSVKGADSNKKRDDDDEERNGDEANVEELEYEDGEEGSNNDDENEREED